MNERTRSYLAGRFRDYYRRRSPRTGRAEGGPVVPPALERREWAYIPFSPGDRTPMVRHRELHDATALADLLVRQRPRHVYHSTATYADPGRDVMGAKGWTGADLVFDLDADHLEGVDPDHSSYREMLEACRDETAELLDILEADLGCRDVTVVFSGNRGYHVHVRDPSMRPLDRTARREIVEYVRGVGLSFDALVATEVVAGASGTAKQRRLATSAGWGRRVHDRLVGFGRELRDRPPEEALETLQAFDDIGRTRAETVLRVFEDRWSDIEAGHVDLHAEFVRFVRIFVEQHVSESGPAIDEPVTTDVHRLIRLPGSLHGKTGLVVAPVDRDALASFDPLEAAIAPDFQSSDIAVEVTEGGAVDLGGTTHRLDHGRQRVPEYLGVFLMARGRAEKVREPVDR